MHGSRNVRSSFIPLLIQTTWDDLRRPEKEAGHNNCTVDVTIVSRKYSHPHQLTTSPVTNGVNVTSVVVNGLQIQQNVKVHWKLGAVSQDMYICIYVYLNVYVYRSVYLCICIYVYVYENKYEYEYLFITVSVKSFRNSCVKFLKSNTIVVQLIRSWDGSKVRDSIKTCHNYWKFSTVLSTQKRQKKLFHQKWKFAANLYDSHTKNQIKIENKKF